VLDQSLEEIAAMLDLTVNAVKAHLARGRARLKAVNAHQRAAADRSSAHRFMVLIPRCTDDSFPRAVEMFLCARRALEFSHDQDPKGRSKRHSITS
jgi:Sigma-70, region 4